MKIFIVLSFLILVKITNVFSQIEIEQFVNEFPETKSKTVSELSHGLVEKSTTLADSFYALFYWVSNNISYDVSLKNSVRDQNDSTQTPQKVLATKKAVCEGYSNLLEALANDIGIIAVKVSGISKNQDNSNDRHAWIAVKINNKWQLCDPTWSSGYLNTKGQFVKSFTKEYIFVEPQDFYKSHYPHDPIWQLLDNPYTKFEFDENIKTASSKPMDYNKLIEEYFTQDSVKELIKSYKRILEFNPGNNLVLNNLASVEIENANEYFILGVEQYNSFIELKKYSYERLKLLDEEKSKSMLSQSMNSFQKALVKYESIITDNSENLKALDHNKALVRENIKLVQDQIDFTERYFNTWKPLRYFILYYSN